MQSSWLLNRPAELCGGIDSVLAGLTGLLCFIYFTVSQCRKDSVRCPGSDVGDTVCQWDHDNCHSRLHTGSPLQEECGNTSGKHNLHGYNITIQYNRL